MQTFTSMEYLYIDIANNFGLDKKNWNERIQWTKDNINSLESLATQADNPCMFRAGVDALRKAQRNEPIGYGIHLDATASGTQWLSILTGDKLGASLCNVINTGKREDSYTLIFNAMKKKVQLNSFKREDVKKAIMTSLYSSHQKPKELFGENLPIFEQTMSEMMPEAWFLNRFFENAWNTQAIKYEWVLPDNFHASFKVKDLVKKEISFLGETHSFYVKEQMPTEKGRCLCPNVIHSLDGFVVREMVQRCSVDNSRAKRVLEGEEILGTCTDILQCLTLWNLYKESGYLSARILNYIYTNTINLVDRAVIEELVSELPKKTFDILPIHDSFTVHPNYGNDVRQQYIYIMYHMSKSDMLNFIFKQFNIRARWKKPFDISKDILNSEYALS